MIVHSSLNPTTDCVTYLQQLLQSSVDSKQSVLLLWSGGSVQTLAKQLCVFLSQFEDISWLYMSLIDERYGEPNHPDSNELLIRETGIVDLIEKKGGHWQPILTGKTMAEETERISKYFSSHQEKTIIGIFGIGEDGHTAGMLPLFNTPQQFDELFKPNRELLYSHFDLDKIALEYPNQFRQRITFNLHGIKHVEQKIIFAIGDKKLPVLEKVLNEKTEVYTCPARILNEGSTQLFTDQKL